MAISYGTDYGYANDRLRGSLITYKGYPFLCQRVRTSGEVEGEVYGTAKFNGERLLLSDCDVTPISLGYVNKRTNAHYYARIPARYYRQGLRNDTVAVVGGGGRSLPYNRQLFNTINQIYPSMDECAEAIVNGETRGRAFSKRFAFSVDKYEKIWLCYKGKKVGRFDGKNPNLDKKFQYLKEQLAEDMK